MTSKTKWIIVVFLLLSLSVVIAACANPAEQMDFSPTVSNEPIAESIEKTQVQETTIITVTGNEVLSTVTPDTRLVPEDWQDWPIIPEVTEMAKDIYRKGLAKGNDSHAFSKVADCQSIQNTFLGFFDTPGKYDLDQDTHLQETIDHFSGYFNRDGEAMRSGFNAAAVLSPLLADPDNCLPDETPLECELRITRPIFVLIRLEFPFTERTPDTYERYMRQIIEYTLSQGAVPILATKADNEEGDHSINYTTAKLAYEYDLPLWNFWAKMAQYPDHGIDSGRDNMEFHLYEEHWNTQSFSFLRVLDNLWRDLRDI